MEKVWRSRQRGTVESTNGTRNERTLNLHGLLLKVLEGNGLGESEDWVMGVRNRRKDKHTSLTEMRIESDRERDFGI